MTTQQSRITKLAAIAYGPDAWPDAVWTVQTAETGAGVLLSASLMQRRGERSTDLRSVELIHIQGPRATAGVESALCAMTGEHDWSAFLRAVEELEYQCGHGDWPMQSAGVVLRDRVGCLLEAARGK